MGGASDSLGVDSLPRIGQAVEGVSVALGPQAGGQYDPSAKLGGGGDAPELGWFDPP